MTSCISDKKTPHFESKFSYKICLFKEGIKKITWKSASVQTAKHVVEGPKCSVTRGLFIYLLFFSWSLYYRRRVSKSFSYTYKVPVCKTGMMSLLQSSPVQHSTAHSSWVNLCFLSPLKKPPTAAQAAFLSVIIGQKRKKSRLLLNLLKGNNTKNLFIFVLACAFSVRNSCLPTLIN